MYTSTSPALDARPASAPLVAAQISGLNVRSILGSEPGVVELVVTGIFHASAAEPFRRAVLAYMSDSDHVCGLIVDLRRATILMDAGATPLPYTEDLDETIGLKPIAMIVPPVSKTQFLQWAWESASAGLMRGAFVDAEEALAWIRSHTGPRLASNRSGRTHVLRQA